MYVSGACNRLPRGATATTASALAVVAVAPRGNLLHAPDTYMRKIACGPAGKGVVHLDKSPQENLAALAKAKGVYVEDLTAIILERAQE